MSTLQQRPGLKLDTTRTRAVPGRRRRFSYYAFLALLGFTAVGGAYPPPGSPPVAAPEVPRPMGEGPAAASPLDEAMRLAAEARRAYQDVRDYSCRLVKRERIDGRMQPQNTMLMLVRTEPFSVDFRWQEPASLSGQEACYVAGQNGGKMRVRPAGFLGVAGFVSLDPNDPRARQSSRHSITEAGLGHLIDQCAAGWERERQWGLSQVRLAEYEYDHRRCVRVEVVHPTNPDRRFLHYRDVVYFDKETHLPIRLEAYDWPRGPKDPGELLESYSYAGLRLNVGVGEEAFNH
jgi:hypothetical protein